MPTYDGFTAANIALGVKEPGRDTFSAGKDFSQVAIDARASMDNTNGFESKRTSFIM